MNYKAIEAATQNISHLIDAGSYIQALTETELLYQEIKGLEQNNSYFLSKSNIAGFYVDIGSALSKKEISEKGLKIFERFSNKLKKLLGNELYFYNLANAKASVINIEKPSEDTFSAIKPIIDAKDTFWKAYKASSNQSSKVAAQCLVNLGNNLCRQSRIVEAIENYDRAIALGFDIPEAWLGRSRALMLLNVLSNSYSIELLNQVKLGYEKAIQSKCITTRQSQYYKEKTKILNNQIKSILQQTGLQDDPHNDEKTKEEFKQLSDYRKFCLEQHLTLSEHGLYCHCVGSARDNLTIPTRSGVIGDFVPSMERVLNQLKSEFSFARKLYFLSISSHDYNIYDHDSYFSDLLNNELLGTEIEGLKAAYKTCFGILDKIAMAICEVFKVYPSNNNIYFTSFWRLNQDNRREKFDKIKNPSLLALYSIATDLSTNKKSSGEWSFLRDIRNHLEHKFLAVCDEYFQEEALSDPLKAFNAKQHLKIVSKFEFLENLEKLLHLTRSAIFSFVFMNRHEANKSTLSDDSAYIKNTIYPQDYI